MLTATGSLVNPEQLFQLQTTCSKSSSNKRTRLITSGLFVTQVLEMKPTLTDVQYEECNSQKEHHREWQEQNSIFPINALVSLFEDHTGGHCAGTCPAGQHGCGETGAQATGVTYLRLRALFSGLLLPPQAEKRVPCPATEFQVEYPRRGRGRLVR